MRVSDPLLTARELQLVEAVRSTALDWRALASEVDAQPTTERALTAADALFAGAAQLGLQRARNSAAVGGLALTPRERLVLLEELAWADAGLATSLGATWAQAAALEILASPSLFKTWVRPCLEDDTGTLCLAGAASEPDHGSEVHRFTHEATLSTVLRTTERGLVLDGTKWMMTNGGRAHVYVVLAQREGTRGFSGRVRVLVPAKSPGLSAVAVNKRGLRTVAHATLRLEQVSVAAEQVLPAQNLTPEQRRAGTASAVGGETLTMAAIALGVGQAALDEASTYTAQRVQSGSRLNRQSTVALRLLELQGRVDVARAGCWHAAELEVRGALQLSLSLAVKAAAIDAARGACAGATELIGSPALEERHLLSKLSRDVDFLSVGLGTVDFWRAELIALGALEPAPPSGGIG